VDAVSALILGPAGVLPPGEWAYGSFVVPNDSPNNGPGYLLPHHRAGFGYVAQDGHSHDPWSWPTSALHLDITTGCLSHACRALLHLVAPDVPQPDCAPVWRAVAQAGGVTRWGLWVGVSMVWTFDCAETNPRRALAMALEAAAGGER